MAAAPQPFLSDVRALRERARKHIEEGPVTPGYEADRDTVLKLAERVAIESYREMIAWLEGRDPTTRRMLESILSVEEEHADELRSMLQDVTAHFGARAGSKPKGVAGR